MPHSSARAQLAQLQSREMSAVELLERHVAENAAIGAQINAVVATDLDRARAEADAIDRLRQMGATLGPLAGLPMTVKDGLDVTGLPARAGNPALLDRLKTCVDAVVVARARAAGAVVWGKTNVPFMLGDFQTFNAFDGTTNNPYDLTRTSGGSSGGSAAALAAGITPLEIGSDIGGSLRHPANFCGVTSLKPTFGLLPVTGHAPPLPGTEAGRDLNVVGPMARTIGDLRILMEALSGLDLSASAGTRPLRVAIWDQDSGFPLSADAKQAVARAASALRHHGADIAPAALPFTGEALLHAYLRLLLAAVRADDPTLEKQVAHLRPLASALGLIDRRVWSPWNMIKAGAASDADRAKAARARDVLKRRMAGFFESHDVILAPVTPTAAFAHDHSPLLHRSLDVDGRSWMYSSCLSWVALATALHLPAVTVPAGRTATGLPIGVQLIGPWNSEARLLLVAEQLEEALGGFSPPPGPSA